MNCLKTITMSSNEENFPLSLMKTNAESSQRRLVRWHMCAWLFMSQQELDTDEHNDTQDQVSSTIGKHVALQAV